ncbi:MAG: Holliday junction branch migration protein RuvA [Alphaproteobacteria bacterium]|nr:Holliday junction branch migration protein RuvA [Alphaproteobacteria bacterium]
MIAKLSGIIDTISSGHLILDVGGVGYQLYCSQKTLDTLPDLGENVTLYVETVVREEYIHLYGFKDPNEQQWFRILLTVQGVGMRVALAILSTFHPSEISQAIGAQDKTFLARAEGVGPKLAARLVNELKDKLATYPTSIIQSGPLNRAVVSPIYEDALLAHINLGYRKHEAMEALEDTHQDNISVENLIRLGLSKLTKVIS